MNKKCFVVCPIGEENSLIRQHSDNVFDHLISPACKNLDIETIRADRINKSGLITDDIFKNLNSDELVIADVSHNNPNVFLEIGYRLKTQLPIILINDKNDSEQFPFDISSQRIMPYDLMPNGLEKSKTLLTDYIENSLKEFDKIRTKLHPIIANGKVQFMIDDDGNQYPNYFYKPKESD